MNYEEKYKQALERAKDLHDNHPLGEPPVWTTCEKIFPELKESEDERIRKEIIAIFKGETPYTSAEDAKRYIAWLERQGEEPIDIRSRHATGKLGEIIKDIESSDKIEPKFKVGDWILYQRTESSREVLQIYDIRDGRYYFNDMCHFSWSIKECDEKSHLWTIKDAKDGEVLAIGNEYFLFKEKKENTSQVVYISHCFADSAGAFRVTNGRDCGEFLSIENGVKACPATKEQCELLFSKMKEAGYEWDSEKKELRKIEQNPADKVKSTEHSYITPNSEFFQWIYDRLKYVYNENPNVDYMLSLKERIEDMQETIEWGEEDKIALDDALWCCKQAASIAKDENDMGNVWYAEKWLKSIKDRVQPQPKQEWSEEDSAMMNLLIEELNSIAKHNDCLKQYESEINWLKSIKPNNWKPSEEQMNALDKAKNSPANYYDIRLGLQSLYNDLLKL